MTFYYQRRNYATIKVRTDILYRRNLWETYQVKVAKKHDIVYGKFFANKAGFISRKWFPVFANYRRNGYDFDALFEDEKAPYKHKKIMDFFIEEKYLKTVCFLPSGFSLL